MTRLIPLAVFALVAAGLFLLPKPDRLRLAALHMASALDAPAHTLAVGDTLELESSGGEGAAPTLETIRIEGIAGHRITYRQLSEGEDGEEHEARLSLLLPRLRPAPGRLSPGTPLDEELGSLLEDLGHPEEGLGQVLRLRLLERALFFGSEDPGLPAEMAGAVLRGLRARGSGAGGYRVLEYTQPEPGLEAFRADEFLAVGLTGSLIEAHGSLPGAVQLILDLPDGRTVWGRAEYHPPDSRSLLPPLVAILLAIILRQPVLALFAGVAVGAILVLVVGGAAWASALLPGLRAVGDTYLWSELLDPDRQKIVAFVVFMLAMVGILIRAGGIHGLMRRIAHLAHDARRTQVAAWLMGLAVFFDDYANTILVGSTMRTLTDKYKVAREKLAYIVDSTAAPVAGISILSTWIAFEVSTFSAQLPDAGLSPDQGYAVFLRTLPYRFYCIFTIFFVGLVVLTGRDFGPMLRAERRARAGAVLREGARPMVGKAATELEPASGMQPKARLALAPIGVFILVTLGYIFIAGGALGMGAELFTVKGITQVLYDGSGFDPLMYGSLAGLVVAILLAALAGLGREIPRAAWISLRSMGIALLILYFAWAIGAICGDLNTAEYLSILIGDNINPLLLPVILFVLSGLVAFATGSSWSTMTILLPLVVGLAYHLGESLPSMGGQAMLVVSIGAVLEGAIFGDHCSPISDTTVMSSISSASDHVDHVRTQMPYAITTMLFAIVCGYLPAVIVGLSPWLSILIGCTGMTVLLYWKGERALGAPHAS